MKEFDDIERTICPTFRQGQCTQEGRITREQFITIISAYYYQRTALKEYHRALMETGPRLDALHSVMQETTSLPAHSETIKAIKTARDTVGKYNKLTQELMNEKHH